MTGELWPSDQEQAACQHVAVLISEALKKWDKRAGAGVRQDPRQRAALADLFQEMVRRAQPAPLKGGARG